MKGRKPKPTALKLLLGNPSKTPLNDAEPQHDPLASTVPAELTDPIARQEWERVADAMSTRGHMTTTDRAGLIAYCQKWAQWLALEREATPIMVPTKTRGRFKINPALGPANQMCLLLLKAAAELGMTPTSRSRVAAARATPVPTAAGRWAGLLK